MKIIVTAGGTMGHINPALAIIEEFQKKEKNLEVIYIGTHDRMEKDIIPKMGYRYIPIEIYGFSKNLKKDWKNLFLIRKAVKQCKTLFLKEKPDVVIGVGGYVTYPVLKAAYQMHIKTFIHEQNSLPGKSNRMISKYADLIGITFLESKKYLKTKGKIVLTGHPCGNWAKQISPKNKEELGISNLKPLVSVVAGSLGSSTLNQKFKIYFNTMQKNNFEVVYITGNRLYDEFVKDAHFPSNMHVFPYMEELPGLFKISNVVISRAGAGSLSEIVALEKPSIIIPSPYVANNHQYYNAKELYERGCITLLEEKDLSNETIDRAIYDLLNDALLREKMVQAMKNESTQDSATIIYQNIKSLLATGKDNKNLIQ